MECPNNKTQPPHKIIRRKVEYLPPQGVGKSGSNRLQLPDQRLISDNVWRHHTSADDKSDMMSPVDFVLVEFKKRSEQYIQDDGERDRLVACHLFGLMQFIQPGLINRVDVSRNNRVVE